MRVNLPLPSQHPNSPPTQQPTRAHRDNIILRKRMTRRMGYFLQLLVLLLPIIARRICESFSCETFQVSS